VSQAGRDAFGTFWKGARSDWLQLAAIVKWDEECRAARLPADHRLILSRLEEPERCQEPLAVLAQQGKPVFHHIPSLFESITLNLSEAFGVASIAAISLDHLSARLRRWREDPEALSQWIGYRMRRNRLEADGLCALVERLHDGRIPGDGALDQFE